MVWRRFPRSCSVFTASEVTLPTPPTPRVGGPNRYTKSPQGEVKSRLSIAVSEQVARPVPAYGQHLSPLNSPHSHSQALAYGQCRQRPHTGPTSWAIRTVAAPTGYGENSHVPLPFFWPTGKPSTLHEVPWHRFYWFVHSPTLIAPSAPWLATRSLFKVANFICLRAWSASWGQKNCSKGERQNVLLTGRGGAGWPRSGLLSRGKFIFFVAGLAFALAFAFALRYLFLCALSLRFYFLRLRCRLCAALVRFCRWQRPKPAPSLCFLCKVIVILL
jgi:hypothetical protein